MSERDSLKIEEQPMVTCNVCGRDDVMKKGNRLAVHFAKVTDKAPCPGSWPKAQVRQPGEQTKGEFRRPAKDQVFDDWPEPDEILHDDTGRILTVTEVRPQDPLGRNVVGKLTDGERCLTASYSCDALVLMGLWRRSEK